VPKTTDERREAVSGVTIARASQLLGVTRRTVHYWIKKGKLQTTALPNGGRRILLEHRQVV
jgi:excisionase family DNA binding protein